jgi:hypothetical protein
MKEIDLSKFAPRSDLADEIVINSNDNSEYSVVNKKYKDVNISYITIHKNNNSFNKKKGDYISVEFDNVEDQRNREIIKDVLVDNLKKIMNKFLKIATNVSYTENGALSYATTNSICVDQFGKAGSFRGRDISIVFNEQEKLWEENKEFAVKFPFYLRMITRKVKLNDNSSTEVQQKGQGCRDEAFKRLLWFANNQPTIFYNNLWLLPIIGSWKDLWVLLTMDDSLDKEKFFSIIAEGCQCNSQIDLIKKYLPQIRSNKKCKTEWSKKTNRISKEFCKWAGWTEHEYRIFKSTGKAHEFQKLISQQKYDRIDWNKISGKALLNIATSNFISNHNLSESYINWIETTIDAKFNGYPYELGMKMHKLMHLTPTSAKFGKMTVDAQFENLIKGSKENNEGIKGNVWCALDTSGSMRNKISNYSNLSAYDVCVSLGIYFSTLNEGAFHKNVIMFDDESHVKKLSGTFSKMYEDITSSFTAYGGTNFQSIVDEIIRIRETHPNIPLTDYPTTLIVVSDMQFNHCGKYTNYEKMKIELYEKFPREFVDSMKFIWWNVGGNNSKDVPATIDDGGCYFFSGFNGNIISLLLGGKSQVVDEVTGEKRTPTMEELISIAMNQEIMKLIKF